MWSGCGPFTQARFTEALLRLAQHWLLVKLSISTLLKLKTHHLETLFRTFGFQMCSFAWSGLVAFPLMQVS